MSQFLLVVKIMEIAFGVMILANFKRPLALILIAPIVVGILMFEIFIAHAPGIAVILFALNAVLIFRYKEHYLPMVA